MRDCNKCNRKISLVDRLKSCIRLKYIIHYIPCEIKCEKCNNIYKLREEHILKNFRNIMYFIFLCYLYTSFKFGTIKNLVVSIMGCIVINPTANIIVSYIAKYEIK